MKNSPIYIAMIAVGSLSLMAGAATARQRPTEPDFSAIASSLNVPASALTSCLGERHDPDQKPPQGERPAGPDAGAVSACLSSAGYSVTDSALDRALASLAPPAPRR